MDDRTKYKTSTIQQPLLELESSSSPFIDNVRNILERDRNTSPFTPQRSIQTLVESHHILTRAYAHQHGLTPIDYCLHRQ